MNGLPREVREGVMRARIGILRQRHTNATWIAVQEDESREEETPVQSEQELVFTE